MSKTYISTFTHKAQDIDILYANKRLSYIFELKGERYGGAVKVEGKSIQNIMSAVACLIIHYLESREAIEKKV